MSANDHQVRVVTVEDDHTYKLNEEALAEILLKPDIKDLPVVLISVAGAYRGGKSFMLNFFLKYLVAPEDDRNNGKWLETGDEPLTGFSWRGGSKRHTTGIVLWSEPIVATLSNGDKVAVLLMDTQGTFDSSSSMRDCSTVFALSTLLSSVQIYNLSGKIQEDNLQHLQLFTEYGKLIKQESGKPFQVLEFLVRDWAFLDDYSYGAIGGQQYLDYQLGTHDDMLPELVELRQHIKSSFESVTCFLMPHPGFKVYNPKFTGSVNDISKEFLNGLKELVPSLFSEAKLKVKQINGQPVKAKELFEYFKTYMGIFTSGHIPTPTSILKATSEAGFLLAVNESREIYETKMTDSCDGDKSVPASDVQQLHREYVSIALALFNNKKKLGSFEDSAEYLNKLEQDLNERLNVYLQINWGKTLKGITDAKVAYTLKVETISKGHLCVHALDLEKVHNHAKESALKEFDSKRKVYFTKKDLDREALQKDLLRQYETLRITNEQNNNMVKSELKEEYFQYMMMKVKNSSHDEFAEEHKNALQKALDAFNTKRSMPSEYTEDVYKFKLQADIEFSFGILKDINNTGAQEVYQKALAVFNRHFISTSDIKSHCLHPEALKENYDIAVCEALQAYRPSRSCGQGFNESDSDEKLILSIFQRRFEDTAEINSSANAMAVSVAFEAFVNEYNYLRRPSWWWLLIIPIFVTRPDYEAAKKLGIERFRDQRLDQRAFRKDIYLTDLKDKMNCWYHSC